MTAVLKARRVVPKSRSYNWTALVPDAGNISAINLHWAGVDPSCVMIRI